MALLTVAACVTPQADVGAGPSLGAGQSASIGILTPEVAAQDGIELGPIPASLPPAKFTEAQARDAATRHAVGGPAAGPVLQVVRAMAHPTESQPARTAWIVVIGPGGTVPVPAVAQSSPLPIKFQIIVLDDQTGAFISDYIGS